jgi:hypothetical protein
MLIDQDYLSNTFEEIENESLYQNIGDIFIKPVNKEFIDEIEYCYLVMSDTGKPLALFSSIIECEHFAQRYNLNCHFLN